ncbi:MAG: long-chain fatty acid--CoA ligase, partial [Bacteroidales bacterium]|nr:long-chain fatty acid--CoA ligase [Bacteroidales bacterium]
MVNELVGLISKQTKRFGDREALRFRDYKTDEWTSMSWNQFKASIERGAKALYKAGLETEGKIAIFSQNCPEILISHFAAYYNRGVGVPIYATSSKSEAAYIINDAQTVVLFVGDQRQYEIAVELRSECPSLKHVVIYNPLVKKNADDNATMMWDEFLAWGDDVDMALVNERKESATPDDLICLIYTSGTTGVPKGVMLSHGNFNSCIMAHLMRIPYLNEETDLSLSFLPMSHIFEFGWSMVCLTVGIRLVINGNPKEIQKAIKEVNPTCMCSVPRFWEKVYTAITNNVANASPIVRMVFNRALAVSKKRDQKYLRCGKKVPALLEKQFQYFDKKVFKKIRAVVGFNAPVLFPVAGAMLSDNITEFLRAIGLPIVIGYGLSETTATVTFYPDTNWELGTIGTCIPGVKVKIGKDNEILVKGPTVMQGYYNKPEETAKAIDSDGWFHTGDAGAINENGQLIITERIKDLFKTSNGKYIAPQVLETRLGQDLFVEQAAVIGDGRKFVSALIVPSVDALKAYAKKKKIAYKDNDDLVNNKQIHKMMEQRIAEWQKDLASYEQIKHFILMPRPFTMETGELTNTLKIRRSVINKRYAKLIDAIYAAAER